MRWSWPPCVAVRGFLGLGEEDNPPDIHLSAARAVAADTSIRVVRRLLPGANIGLAVDELEITRALGIAVAGTVLGAGLVARVLGLATVLVHRDKVQGTIETAAGFVLV